MPASRLSKFAATLLSVLVLFSALAAAQHLKIGSGNTAFADPPVPRPKTTPCKVQLYSGFKFENFNPQSFNYTPPAGCPGPWAAVILEVDLGITKGIQYDRTANIWIGPANIYFGTTAEDQPNEGRNWHVERDLTDYSAIFTSAQVGTVDLGNEVNKTYTGILHGSADILFYPLAQGQQAAFRRRSGHRLLRRIHRRHRRPRYDRSLLSARARRNSHPSYQHRERLFGCLCPKPERR